MSYTDITKTSTILIITYFMDVKKEKILQVVDIV